MHLLFLAGIGNSSAGHWQREWYSESENATWVEHSDWDNPVMEQWLDDLNTTLKTLDEPVTVVAHSMGCILFTEWLRRCATDQIAAAMLVAIPDVFSPAFPPQASNFSNLITEQPCCPAVIIVSEDDPYGSVEHAREQGNALNATVHSIGRAGHINASSGLGNWAEGKAYLKALIDSIS
jgi:hypothetical protein